MELIVFLFFYVTPYIAVTLLIGGMTYRLYHWRQKKPVPAHLSLFPRPQGRWGRLLDTLVDMFTLRGLWQVNKPLWAGGSIMHLGLLLLLLGHSRLFTDYSFLWRLLRWGQEQQVHLSHVAGTIAGLLFMVPLFYLLARRFSGAVKWLSTPEDFLLLFLLLGIAITGNHMRLLREVDVHEIRRFLHGLAFFRWQTIPATAGTSFRYHFTLVQILMVCFPFSKLTHTIGAVFSKMVARS